MHNMHCISNSFFLFKSHKKSVFALKISGTKFIVIDLISFAVCNSITFSIHTPFLVIDLKKKKNIQTPVYSLFSLFILTPHQFIFSTKISSLNSQTQHIIEMENYKIRIELEFLNLRQNQSRRNLIVVNSNLANVLHVPLFIHWHFSLCILRFLRSTQLYSRQWTLVT